MPKTREDFSRQSPPPKPDPKFEADEMYRKHKEMLKATYRPSRNGKQIPPEDVDKMALYDAIANFNLAKKLHKENLEHEPLPDTVTDALYRQLQLEKSGKDPGLGLPEGQYATGVGWKGYPGYGPNRCTKMKVYRPKTALPSKPPEKRDGRPNSVSSFDKKWRFLRQSKVSPIELAICWDLSPENPADEPKPPTHIDGSNGSSAPAVFSLVHSAKESSRSSRKTSDASNNDALFDRVPENDIANEALPFLDRPKTGNGLKQRAQSVHDLYKKDEECQCSLDGRSGLARKKLFESSPNVCQRRVCGACELIKSKPVEKRVKPEFKQAFKAGVPQRTVSTAKKRSVKVPKQREPYKRKGYAIKTLVGPFCLQKDNRQDYPEHWRLATVYQQSYKPIHTRKRPLLATIFK